MSLGSIWSITHRPSCVACRPFGCWPGVIQRIVGSTLVAMSVEHEHSLNRWEIADQARPALALGGDVPDLTIVGAHQHVARGVARWRDAQQRGRRRRVVGVAELTPAGAAVSGLVQPA